MFLELSEVEMSAGRKLQWVSSARAALVVVEVDRLAGKVVVRRTSPDRSGAGILKTARRGRVVGRPTASAGTTSKKVSISRDAIERVVRGLRPGIPLNLDAALNGSGSNRTCIETILLRHPEIYIVYAEGVGRNRGRKHLLWDPAAPHAAGEVTERAMSVIMSAPAVAAPVLPSADMLLRRAEKALSKLKLHQQQQAMLCRIAADVGLHYRLARDDQNITVGRLRLSLDPSAVPDLARTSPFDREPKAPCPRNFTISCSSAPTGG